MTNFLSRYKFIVNISSTWLAYIFSNLISLITLGYVARKFGVEVYGLYSYSLSIVGFVGTILSPGLLSWGIRAIAQNHSNAPEFVSNINFCQTILATIGYLFLVIFSFITKNTNPQLLILLAGLNLYITAINIDWAFVGLQLSSIPAWTGVFSTILNTAGLLLFIKSPEHIYRLIILTTGISTFSECILYIIFFYKLKLKLVLPSLNISKQIIIYSLPLGISSILTSVSVNANNLIVKTFLGFSSVGNYYASYRLIYLFITFIGLVNPIVYSRLAKEVVENKDRAIGYTLIYLKIVLSISSIIASLVFFEANFIINTIYGIEYVESINLLRLLSICIILDSVYGCYVSGLIAFKKDRNILLSKIVILLATISSILLIPKVGLVGVVFAQIIASAFGLLIIIIPFKRIFGSIGITLWLIPFLNLVSIFILSLLLKNINIGLRVAIELLFITLLLIFQNLRELKNIVNHFHIQSKPEVR